MLARVRNAGTVLATLGANAAMAPPPLGFHELLGEGVEIREEAEVAVEAVESQNERLVRLRGERGHLRAVEDDLARPELDSAVAQVADKRGSRVERIPDRPSSRLCTQLPPNRFAADSETRGRFGRSPRHRASKSPAASGSSATGTTGPLRERPDFLERQDFFDHDPGLGYVLGGNSPHRKVGQAILTVNRGVGSINRRERGSLEDHSQLRRPPLFCLPSARHRAAGWR